MKEKYIEKLQNYIRSRLNTDINKEEDKFTYYNLVIESVNKLPDEVYLPVFHEIMKKEYKEGISKLGILIIHHFIERNIPIQTQEIFQSLEKGICENIKYIFKILVKVKYLDLFIDLFEEESIFRNTIECLDDEYVEATDYLVQAPDLFHEKIYKKAVEYLTKNPPKKLSIKIFDMLVRIIRITSPYHDVSFLLKLYKEKELIGIKKGIVERELVLKCDPSCKDIFVKILEEGNHLYINEFILQLLYKMQYSNMNRVYKAINNHKFKFPRLYIKYISHQHQTDQINIIKAVIKIAEYIAELYNNETLKQINNDELKNAIISYNTNKIFHEELTAELIDKQLLIPKAKLLSYNMLIDSYIKEWGINNKIQIF